MTITKDGNEINTGNIDAGTLEGLPRSLMDVPENLRAGVSLAVQSAAANVSLLLQRRDHAAGTDKLALALVDALPPSLLNEWLGMDTHIGYGDYYQLDLPDMAVGPAVMFATLAALMTAGEADHPEVNISLAAWDKSAGSREPMPADVSEYILTILTAAGADGVYETAEEVVSVRQSTGGQDGDNPLPKVTLGTPVHLGVPTENLPSTNVPDSDIPVFGYKSATDIMVARMQKEVAADIARLESATDEVTTTSSGSDGSSGGGSADTNWFMVGAVVVAGAAVLYGAHQLLSEGETEDVVIVDLDNSW